MQIQKLNKKIIISLSVIFLCARLAAFDFSLHVQPSYEIPLNGFLNKAGGFGVNLGLNLSPITIRSRDQIYVTGQFTYTGFYVEGFGLQTLLDGNFGAGYNVRFADRWDAFAEAGGGVWSFPSASNFSAKNVSGLSFYGKAGADYYLSPALSVTAFAGYKSFYAKPESLTSTVELGLGLKYSLAHGLFKKDMIELSDSELSPLFPVFYAHYAENPFGQIGFINNEPNDIYDVSISILIDSYMTSPSLVAEIENVPRGGRFEVDVCAFLSENILDLVQPKSSDMEVTVNYSSLGKAESATYLLPITALSRNSMTWEDDRRAAAFVSGKDAAAQKFARRVQGIVKNELKAGIPVNIQYAAAIFGALKAFGINYVVDPSSAFTDNVGTASVDFLQFPYQTLVYHGGDCDDLTILNCSLLEALGIETAFITVPGHIFMAFDSGLSLEEGRAKTSKGYYIEAEGKIWVPFEVTLSQDTFGLAWTYGAREWKKAGSDAALIPLMDAWASYLPISVPGADAKIEIPSREEIIKLFREAKYY